MRKIVFKGMALVICMAFIHHLQAQTAPFIRGQVLNSQKKPVVAATVSLLGSKDSSIQNTVAADETGNFIVSAVKEGNWLISVSAVGYKKYYSSLILVRQQNINLPVIQLVDEAAKELNSVTVTANKSFTEQKIDRTVVNVDALISNTGTNALEVLEKTPGVMVDENGAITFKGKAGVLVLIDDKPTYLSATDLAAYLRSLSSSALDKIELMDNPPAKYDAAGNAGVINIKTKKNQGQKVLTALLQRALARHFTGAQMKVLT